MAGCFCSWARDAQDSGFGCRNILSHYLECPQIHKSAAGTTKQSLCIYGGWEEYMGCIECYHQTHMGVVSPTECKKTKMPFVSGRGPWSASSLVTVNREGK